jgi:hypothetical protein
MAKQLKILRELSEAKFKYFDNENTSIIFY